MARDLYGLRCYRVWSKSQKVFQNSEPNIGWSWSTPGCRAEWHIIETNSARSPTASFAAPHFADILCLCLLIVRRSFPILDSPESSNVTLIPTRMKPGQSLDYKFTHQLYTRPPQSFCLLITGDTFQPLTVGRRPELSTCLKPASSVCLEWYARTSPPFHVCNAQIWSCLMQVNNHHSPCGHFLYSIFWPRNESRAWPHLFSST